MSNNFRRTAVLKKKKKNELQTKDTKQRIVLKNLWGVPVLKFLERFVLDFPYICLQFFPGLSTDKCIQNLKKIVLGLLAHVTPSFFFSRILRSEALVYNSYFFRKTVLWNLFDIGFSYKHSSDCNFSLVCLLYKMASKTVTFLSDQAVRSCDEKHTIGILTTNTS